MLDPDLTAQRVTPGAAGDRLGMTSTGRIATLMEVPGLLKERGVDAARLFAEFHLDPAYFEEPENSIPFATMGKVLGRCAEQTRSPHFGLLVGQRTGISAIGAVGFLMQSSPDVRAALGILTHRYHAHNTGATLSIAEDASFVVLSYTILQADVEYREHILDGAMAVAFNIMRALCGQSWLPIEVRFARARPDDLEPFRRFFGATLYFDAEETALVFARHWLDKALPSADPLLHKMMLQRLSEQELASRDDIVGHLRRMLPQLVATQSAALAVVANRVGLGVRTLNRRLAAEGVSFARLRDEARYTIARQLLQSTRMPAHQIADYLGFANASGFTRAFRRWSGMRPSQWRSSRRRRLQAADARTTRSLRKKRRK
jgi:AraC-like DNA-binding protein